MIIFKYQRGKTMKYRFIKIIGINGFEFFVGEDSIMHDYAKEAKKLGVQTQVIESDYDYRELVKNLDKAQIFNGSVNKDKLATENQIHCLHRHMVNVLKNPAFPTPGITVEMCA